jgi:hypothetical protein
MAVAAAVATVTALGLTGCGSSSRAHAVRPPVSKLCVDVSVPLSGRWAAVGRALVTGIRMQIPVGGLSLGAYRVRLCDIRDDAASGRRSSAEAALANATQAAAALNTIADIGELSATDAQTAEAVLAPAGIALLTPSGPVPRASVAPAAPAAPAAAAPVHNTALYLLPSVATELDAVSRVGDWHDCSRRRRGVDLCTVLGPVGPAQAPLCTGISETSLLALRYCVMGGPDLAGWVSPAQAYGDAAAKLLVSDLRQVVAGGRDIADRDTVLGTLRRARLGAGQSPIGPVRFDDEGAMEADEFSAYIVQPDGGLVHTRTFRAH